MRVEVEIPDGSSCMHPAGWTCELLGLSHSSDEIAVYCVRVNADVVWHNGQPIKHPNCPNLEKK